MTRAAGAIREEDGTRRSALRGLAVFFAVLLPLSGACQLTILLKGGDIEQHGPWVLALMWTPAVASLIARLLLREPPRDVSFGFGGWRGARALGLALAYPLLVAGLAYGCAWATGLERFEAPASHIESSSALEAFLRRLLLQSTLGALVGCIAAGGEEIGWRGYLLTRLIDAGVRRPVLVSGLIWAGWHVPLILSGQYAAGRYPLLSALLFIPTVVCGGYVAARLRLESGSVWPAIFYHAAWNAIIQSVFDRYTAGGSASRGQTLWTGESGVLVAAASVLVVLLVIARKRFELRRTTRGEAGESVRLLDL